MLEMRGMFSPGHLNQCAAKQAICNIYIYIYIYIYIKYIYIYIYIYKIYIYIYIYIYIKKNIKTGHLAKMYWSKIAPIPMSKTQPRGAYQRPQGQGNSQLRVRQIQENFIEEEQNDTEAIDPEAALYIKELTEDCADVNHIAPTTFSEIETTTINKTQPKEIWIETTISNKNEIQWLADTGSPRSFINHPRQGKRNHKEEPGDQIITVYETN